MKEKNRLTGEDYRRLCDKSFYQTSIALIVVYVLQLFAEMLGNSLMLILLLISVVAIIVSYVFSFRGFFFLKKANALEDTAYPNTGKNFFNLNIAFCLLYFVFVTGLAFILIVTTQMKESASENAMTNAKIIYGFTYAFVNIFSLTTVLALYIMRIFNIGKIEGKQDNFALFTAIFLLMSLGITVIANIYTYGSTADDTVLSVFSGILRIASFAVLYMFFKKRK